jgi:hypothetical protein
MDSLKLITIASTNCWLGGIQKPTIITSKWFPTMLSAKFEFIVFVSQSVSHAAARFLGPIRRSHVADSRQLDYSPRATE